MNQPRLCNTNLPQTKLIKFIPIDNIICSNPLEICQKYNIFVIQ